VSILIDKANLADRILHNNTKYFTDKEIIKGIFDDTQETYSLQSIIFRLTIIDSYYSTQMSKRYFGIEDIAKSIWRTSINEEITIRDYFLNFAADLQNKDIYKLFNHKTYGIHKDGTNAGRATSLISKYAYYQTGYNFPIYDSLAKKIYPLILKKYFPTITKKGNVKSDNIIEYITSINQLKQLSGIANYDRLDNLLWLSGKILSGNFSLLFKEKEEYKSFAHEVEKHTNQTFQSQKGKQIKYNFSDRIFQFISGNNHKLKKIIINADLCEFIEFALNLRSDLD
jgi:hypothetical protein